MTRLNYLPLVNVQSENRRQAESIYNVGFEDDERMPFDRLVKWLNAPKEKVVSTIGAFQADHEIIGMGSAAYFQEEKIGYLVYLAVRQDLRGSGYGSRIVRSLLDWIERTAAQARSVPRMTFWEVRDPADAPDEKERDNRQRRIRFYAHFKACPLPIKYVCPPIEPGQPEVPYLLMVLTDPPERPIDRQDALDVARLGLIKVNGAGSDSRYWKETQKSIDLHWPDR